MHGLAKKNRYITAITTAEFDGKCDFVFHTFHNILFSQSKNGLMFRLIERNSEFLVQKQYKINGSFTKHILE